jgi:HAD superfamily phosphoserine phosphatase-like hydrolase
MTHELLRPTARRQPNLVPDFLRALPAGDSDSLAVFDADGTLWVNDVADDFTQWMIARGQIPGENWPTYMRIYRDDPPTGCRYLLTFYTGLTRAELADQVDTYWAAHPRDWIDEVLQAVYLLADRGYPIWIVSGTPTDFLLPLQRILPVAEVVGMDFALDQSGAITGEHAGIACAGEGKAEKLAQVAGGRMVSVCCGNGSLDGPMMELAETAWSVYPNPAFAEVSRGRGWPILPRPADFVEEEKFLLED